MFINSSPCHCIYFVPLFYICGYYYMQTKALLKAKDIYYVVFQQLVVLHTLLAFCWMATWKASLLRCLLFMNKYRSLYDLFLVQNASATICSWTVRHVTALIAFHYFTPAVPTLRKQQRYWKLKTFNVSFQKFDNLHTLLVLW